MSQYVRLTENISVLYKEILKPIKFLVFYTNEYSNNFKTCETQSLFPIKVFILKNLN